MEIILLRLVAFVFVIPAIIAHEYAHGWVSYRLGDPTPLLTGRLKLNPKAHIDPFWTLILPLFLILSGSPVVFGMAKPVSVDPRYYKDQRKGMALTGAAGPLANLTFAVVASLLYRLFSFLNLPYFLLFVFELVVEINIVLALFNLIPIPPLDGSRIVNALLPQEIAYEYMKLERYGFLILVVLITVFRRAFWAIIEPAISFLIKVFLG